VELDTTVYGVPALERVERWAAATPEGFRFCTKAPRLVTHELGLDRAAGPMGEFVDVMRRGLGEKLGVVVLQFSPEFTADEFPKLQRFLKELPADVRFAVEFRDRSWGTDQTLALLRERRVCLVAAEYLSRPRQVISTTDFLYVRWVGKHHRFDHAGREKIDPTESLQWWKGRIEEAAAGAAGTVWGFFNDDYSGFAIAACERFKRMVGVEVKERIGEAGLFG
jgi:uncharacterized protein YecE (DUF72 family)